MIVGNWAPLRHCRRLAGRTAGAVWRQSELAPWASGRLTARAPLSIIPTVAVAPWSSGQDTGFSARGPGFNSPWGHQTAEAGCGKLEAGNG